MRIIARRRRHLHWVEVRAVRGHHVSWGRGTQHIRWRIIYTSLCRRGLWRRIRRTGAIRAGRRGLLKLKVGRRTSHLRINCGDFEALAE
jgi:hypothetical protein